MSIRKALLLILSSFVLAGSGGAIAQTKDVTVSFLRAAASSLSDRANVSFDAIFVAQQGMVEPQSWNMKGRGLSRFSVKDPQSQAVFPNMYCNQDSKAFRELVSLESNKVVHINGYKDSGENNHASIFVTSVEVLSTPPPPASPSDAAGAKSFRIVIKDAVTGTKTVLVNVIPGKTYTSDNLAITVEVEKDNTAVTGQGTIGNP